MQRCRYVAELSWEYKLCNSEYESPVYAVICNFLSFTPQHLSLSVILYWEKEEQIDKSRFWGEKSTSTSTSLQQKSIIALSVGISFPAEKVAQLITKKSINVNKKVSR